jgi:PAS domain S-box-containing protein
MDKKNENPVKKWQITIFIIFLTLLIIAGGYTYYVSEQTHIRKEKHQEIMAVSRLKIEQIVQWLKERKSEAEFFSNNPTLMHNTGIILQNKDDKNGISYLTARLEPILRNHFYENIFITDSSGKVFFSLRPLEEKVDSNTLHFIKLSASKKQILNTDFYYCTKHGKIHFDNVAPIIDETGNTIATLIFRVDPSEFLFPMIQSWPTPSYSAETVIIKDDGENVLFLSQLRHVKNNKLSFRISKSKAEVPAVKAVSGYEGIFEGIDYRGTEVLSDIRRIPNTPWFMITKIDKAEIYSELQFRGIVIILFTCLLIISIGFVLGWYYNHRQKSIYKSLLSAKHKLFETGEEFRTTLYSIGDAVITTDKDGFVRNMNPVAEHLTGWNESDAKGKNLKEVFKIVNEDSHEEVECPVDKVLKKGMIVGLANHTLLISKSGNEIPIADSGAPIKNETGEIIGVVLIFRDQTEERRAAREIKNLNRVYALLSNTNKAIVRKNQQKELFDEVCSIAIKDGKFNIVWIGILNKETKLIEVVTAAQSGRNNNGEEEVILANLNQCQCLSEIVLKTKNSFITNDLQNEQKVLECKNGEILTDTKSAASFPIKLFGNIVGTLNLFVNQADFFHKGEIKLLEDLTQDISFAIEYIETEKIRSEIEMMLKKKEALLSFAGKMAKFGAWSVDLKTNTIMWSDEVADIHEVPRGYLPDVETGISFYTPESKPKIAEVFNLCASKGIPYDEELEIITANGNRRWVRTLGKAVTNENGEIVRVDGAFQDISSRKKDELNLIKEKEWSNRIINLAPYIIIGLGKDSNIMLFNNFAENLTGYSKDEVFGKSWIEFFIPEEIKQKVHQVWNEIVSDKQFVNTFENEIVTKSGEKRLIKWSNSLLTENDEFKMVLSMGEDITEQRYAEESLRKSEEFNRIVMDNLPIGIAVNTVKPDVQFQFVNDNFVKFYRTTKEALTNPDGFWEAAYPDPVQREAIKKKILDDCATGNPDRMHWDDIPIIRQNEETTYISAQNFPIPEKDLMISLVWDVTERKLNEKKLFESEERLNKLVENTNAVLYKLSYGDMKYEYLHPAIEKLTGYTPEEIVSMGFDRIVEKIERVGGIEIESEELIENREKLESEYHADYLIKRKDGTLCWLSDFSYPSYNEKGDLVGSTGILTDITYRKEAEQAINTEKIKFEQLFENSPVAIALLDEKNRVVTINSSFSKLFGYSLKEIEDTDIDEFITSEDYKEEAVSISGVTHIGKSVSQEGYRKRKDGVNIFVKVAGVPVITNDKTVNIYAMYVDLTERKKVEEEIQKAKEKAEELSRVKSYFFANMSHELRTPLIGILGFSEIMQDYVKENNELLQMARTIHSSGYRLLETLNNILRISKIESEKVDYRLQETNIIPIIDECLNLYSQIAKASNIDLKKQYKTIALMCNVDKGLFREVMNNLISNSIKFSPDASIFVNAKEKGGKAIIEVKDTGIGIPDEKKELIWEAFRQVSEGLNRGFEGTGLGLTISKKYIELMKGKIYFESEEGKGTTFTIELPISVKN